jgi:hypothetical protein
MIAENKSSKEIGAELSIHYRTVEMMGGHLPEAWPSRNEEPAPFCASAQIRAAR